MESGGQEQQDPQVSQQNAVVLPLSREDASKLGFWRPVLEQEEFEDVDGADLHEFTPDDVCAMFSINEEKFWEMQEEDIHLDFAAPRSPEPVEQAQAMEEMSLKVYAVAGKSGFESWKDLQPSQGMKIAGRFSVEEEIGEAAFSVALRAIDLSSSREVCLKVIKNNKDFFDQALDEIRLLKHLKRHEGFQEHIPDLLDFFYFKEHLFLSLELLGDNLFNGWSKVRKQDGAIHAVFFQMASALKFVHDANIIHCDVKPENILIASASPLRVKLIDFGSSCFKTDRLSSYIQSRFYRAPEVALGSFLFDSRIDVWSLGCVIGELISGEVVFDADNALSLLIQMVCFRGPFPREMIQRSRFGAKFFVNGVLFEEIENTGEVKLVYPRRISLASKLGLEKESHLCKLLCKCLQINPDHRFHSSELVTALSS